MNYSLTKDSQQAPLSVVQKSPLQMQYLGGKSRIASKILETIDQHFSGTTFIDLFAGSGVVSYLAMTKGYKVLANDLQPYSSTVLNSLLRTPTNGLEGLVAKLSCISDQELFSAGRNSYFKEYQKELGFIDQLGTNNLDWEQYKQFCDSSSLCNGQKEEVSKLKQKSKWILFLAYYRNTYFGVRQSAEIDFLRELSISLEDNLKEHLIASTISALTYCVSSTTHLAQFLKPSSKKNATNLLTRRSMSVISMVINRLLKLAHLKRPKTGEVFNKDFRDAALEIAPDSRNIIYADPPYFKEHYSRYYHILDTFTLYDYPQLTYNARISQTTIGRYRENRLVSDFGKKSKVKAAFNDLVNLCHTLSSPLAVSYASSSLVPKEYFQKLADDKGLKLDTYEFNLVHTGQGQARHKEVTEYLFLFSQ